MSLRSLSAPSTSSAAAIRAMRRSMRPKSSIEMLGTAAGSGAAAPPGASAAAAAGGRSRRRGDSGRLQVLRRCIDERLRGRRIDAGRKRLVAADRRAEQRLRNVVPLLRRQAEEPLRTGGEARHDGLQVHDQRPEQVQSLGADALHVAGLRRILGHEPRLALVDVEVGAVGELHHFAHHRGEVASLVGGSDPLGVPAANSSYSAGSGSRSASLPAEPRAMKPAQRLAMFTSLPTTSEFTLATKSSRFRSRSSTPGPRRAA